MQSLLNWIILSTVALMVGSFLNVVIYRGPSMWGLLDDDDNNRGSLLAPRSYCPHCRQKIPFWRLIPIVSFLIQRGRCAACEGAISIRYPIVEAASLAVVTVSILTFGFTLGALLSAVLGWFLIALAMIDLETGYLPDWLTIPLVLVGLGANAGSLFTSPTDAVIGALLGFFVFTLIGIVFKRLRGYEALGGGDAKLLAALGAWGGWMILPPVVLIASLTTLAVIGLLHFTGKTINSTTPIPFGPGLCLAGYGVFLVSF